VANFSTHINTSAFGGAVFSPFLALNVGIDAN